MGREVANGAEPSSEPARISGKLPSGPDFSAWITLDLIALRVGDRVCLAGPTPWMSVEMAQRAAEALAAVCRG